MKVTLDLEDALCERLRSEARRRDTTVSKFVEEALRHFLHLGLCRAPLPPLPVRDCGPFLVDIADRNALYDVFDEEAQ